MSSMGPPPSRRNADSGASFPGRLPSMRAVPASGRPIHSSSISLRQVWRPAPRKVSGAQPTRRFLLSAKARRARPSSVSSASARFLAVDVFSGAQDVHAHLGVNFGHREVDDDVDGRVREQRVNADGLDAPFFGLFGGRFHVEVGAGLQMQGAEHAAAFLVGGGDVATADDADVQRGKEERSFIGWRGSEPAIYCQKPSRFQ